MTTTAQSAALLWLHEHGNDGVFVRGNVVLAHGTTAPFEFKTWKSLMNMGLCEKYGIGRGRIKISATGEKRLTEVKDNKAVRYYLSMAGTK